MKLTPEQFDKIISLLGNTGEGTSNLVLMYFGVELLETLALYGFWLLVFWWFYKIGNRIVKNVMQFEKMAGLLDVSPTTDHGRDKIFQTFRKGMKAG